MMHGEQALEELQEKLQKNAESLLPRVHFWMWIVLVVIL